MRRSQPFFSAVALRLPEQGEHAGHRAYVLLMKEIVLKIPPLPAAAPVLIVQHPGERAPVNADVLSSNPDDGVRLVAKTDTYIPAKPMRHPGAFYNVVGRTGTDVLVATETPGVVVAVWEANVAKS